ncbi:MAG: TDT family transporter [Methanomassiliicoccales archaeon]
MDGYAVPRALSIMVPSEKNSLFHRIAKKTPVPLAGLMLGLASVGNLVPDYRWAFGIFAFAILAVLVVKVLFDPRGLKEEFKNPGILGISCTFPMGLAVLSTYFKPFSFDLAFGIWIIAMAIHISLQILFTKNVMFKFDVKKCLPCYFVVYVGFGVNAFIAPAYGQQLLGQMIFWFGLMAYLALLPPLLYRAVFVKGLHESLIPTLVIFAAPANVVLYGYLKAYSSPEQWMVTVLLAMSIIFYTACLALLPGILRMKFYPSYSSLTFPLAISGIATNATYQYFVNLGNTVPALEYLAIFELGMAVIFVSYVLLRYLHHFLVPKPNLITIRT